MVLAYVGHHGRIQRKEAMELSIYCLQKNSLKMSGYARLYAVMSYCYAATNQYLWYLSAIIRRYPRVMRFL